MSNQPVPASEIDNIKKYLNLVTKRKFLFTWIVICIVSLSVVAGYVLPQVYKASSTVFIEHNVIGNLIEGIAVTPSMEERLRVLSYSLKSRNLLLRVIEKLDLDLAADDQAGIDGLVRKLQEETNIEMKGERKGTTDLFIVSFQHRDPEFARDYVNTLIQLYIEKNLSEKRDEAFVANSFLSEQIEYFKNKLDSTDEKIMNFRKEKGIFVAVDENRVVDEIKDTQENLEELGVQKQELEAKKRLVEKKLNDEQPYAAAILGSSGDNLNQRLVKLEARMNELMVDYTENYPEVLRIRAEIESIKERLNAEPRDSSEAGGMRVEMSTLNPVHQDLKEELSDIDLALVALTTRANHLQKVIDSKKKYLRSIPLEKKKLSALERDRDKNKKIYDELIFRLGQSEVSKQMEVQDKSAVFRVVDPAVLPTRSASPNRLKIILVGIFAGFAGSFGLLVMLDNMDKSVRNIDMLKRLGLPVLAVIPKIETKEDQARDRRNNLILYTVVTVYSLCIMGISFMEFGKLH